MASINRKQLLSYISFALVLIIARGLRELNVPNVYPIPTIIGLVQTLLYVGLIASWCISVRHRIMQPQICVMLEHISALMMFWHLTKGIKYHIVAWLVGEGWLMRYLWYLYYLPLLLIPAFLVMIALTLRKPESFRLPKKVKIILFFVSVVLFLIVITNDIHQLVFNFPEDAVIFTDSDYSRGILYYICFAWIIGASLTFFATTLKTCRLPNKKLLWLPIVPIVVCVIYSILYIFANGVWFTLDFTTMFTFSIILLFEITILVGLIPSNNHYEELFRASDRSGVITDENLSVIYASKNAKATDKKLLQKVVEQGSVTVNGKRINFSPITGGYVFWKEDITKLLEVNERLKYTKEELSGYNCLLEEENKQKKRLQKLFEQQKLYESIRNETQHQRNLLLSMATELQETEDTNQAKALLKKITVVGAYLKRRSNLNLLAGKMSTIPLSEVELCIKESVTYLKSAGISAGAKFISFGETSGENAERLYDFFESAVELSFDTMKAITVMLKREEETITLFIMIECDAAMNMLEGSFSDSDIKNEEGTWFCSLSLWGGDLL